MNLFYHSTLAGIIGAAFVNIATYIFRFLGVKTSTPWEIGASVFLNPGFIHTVSGVVIGLTASVALSTAVALVIAYVLKWTGPNQAWLKGIICADGLGFINLGFFMRFLDIWPQIRNEPGTNLMALTVLSILGIIQALLLKNWQHKGIGAR
ncbi:MAG TPA: hypothetical protein VF531_03980 [Bacillota bacterium]